MILTMPDNYLETREKLKKDESKWTTKQKIFNYLFMTILIIGLAFYPKFGNVYLVVLIIVLVLLNIILKKVSKI